MQTAKAAPIIPKVAKTVIYATGISFVNDHPVPTIGSKEVLVKVRSASINPIDYKLPNLLPMMSGKRVGFDFSGEIVHIGPNVNDFRIGDAVFGIGKGALSEYCAADAFEIAKKPNELSFDAAAALPLTYGTSFQALRDAGVGAGSRLLLLGASGGCGLPGVQLAKQLGAHVTAVCSGRNAALVRRLGADAIVDYTQQPLPAALSAGGGAKFDAVYDTVSSPDDHQYEPEARPFLRADGRYVALNSASKLDKVLGLLRSATGLDWQRRGFSLVYFRNDRATLEELGRLTAAGTAQPVLDSVLPFDAESVRAGFERLRSRRAVGKIIFRPGGDMPAS